jgi:hypothetical protein
MSSPRWLWISAEVNNRLATGLLVYSHGLSAAVAQAGVDITMVGIGPPDTRRDDVSLEVVDGSLRHGFRGLGSSLPNLSWACATPEMRETVARLLAKGGWDAIVVDHLQTAWVHELLPPRTDTPVVFVTHNHESSVRRQMASEIPLWQPRGPVLRFDAMKAARLERRMLARADVVTSITEADQVLFRRDAPLARHVVVTPGWSDTPPTQVPAMAERPRAIGILGSFEWHVKQDNLLEFVRAAGPILESAGVALEIGGKTSDGFRARLEAESSVVHYNGWVDSIGDFLGGVRIGVVAEPRGGGFKLKSLDYVAHRVPVAAITGSLEGLPLVAGTSLIEADDAEHLAHELVRAIDDPSHLEKQAEAAFLASKPTLLWQDQVRLLTEAVLR